MKTIAFYDTKPYDKIWFDQIKSGYGFEIRYFENKLNGDTAMMANGCDGVIAFVNDTIDEKVINTFYDNHINIVALRSAGYNNVDFKEAYGKVHIVRVPAYSPYAVAEHAMALLLALNRKINHAYNRTRDYNFSLKGLIGFDLHGKTAGVIGTGKIGKVFVDICRGFGMAVLAYDPYQTDGENIEYVKLDELFKKSDVISLHCPLTKETRHMINKKSLSKMKDGAFIINTSRGALIDSEELIKALKSGKVGGAGLDVYEEETNLFYEDLSNTIIQDDVLTRLVSMPNVIVTSHQAFLTNEALKNIAEMTLQNLKEYFGGGMITNEICYQCEKKGDCKKDGKQRCF